MTPKRHQYQIGASAYRVEPKNGPWWVVESFDVMGRQRTRDDREEWLGPFGSEDLALAKRDELKEKDHG